MVFFRIRTVLYRVIVSDIDRKLCGGGLCEIRQMVILLQRGDATIVFCG